MKDKLHFDCFRVGKVKENIEEMEPVIRNANMLSFDIAAIQNAHAPANRITPNGFTGEEACTLMQYAGLSNNISSIGLYGYIPKDDVHQLTAKQASHMLWYVMDGVYKSKQEAELDNTNEFNEFHLAFADVQTSFLQSKMYRQGVKCSNCHNAHSEKASQNLYIAKPTHNFHPH